MNDEAQRSPVKTINPKVKKFLAELSNAHERIFNKYGMEVVPSLSVTAMGIKPTLALKDRPVKKVKKGTK